MKSELEPIVKEALAEVGLELFELRRGGTRNRPVVDVRIDRTDGQNISIEDCARASRAIEAKLDVDRAAAAGCGGLEAVRGEEGEREERPAWRNGRGRDSGNRAR